MNLLKESFIYKIFISINTWISNMISNSAIINGFLREKDVTKRQEDSLIIKLINKIISILRFLMSKLKLDKLLEGSIFARPEIWVTLVLVLSPFLPTMLVLALVLFTGFTLILKAAIYDDFKLQHFKTNTWVLAFAVVVGFSVVVFGVIIISCSLQ